MLRMSKLADYGILLMMHAGGKPGEEHHTARSLALEANLPLPTVTKILKSLTRAGLLASHRGQGGGYSTTRDNDQISVIEVISAIDGPFGLTQCTSSEVCGREMFCPTRDNWQIITETVLDALTGLTLAQMARPVSQKNRARLTAEI